MTRQLISGSAFRPSTMKTALLLLGLCISHVYAVKEFPSLDHLVSSTPLQNQAEAAMGVIRRVVPDHAAKFSVAIDPTIGPKFKDTFKVATSGGGAGHVSITASSGYAATWGFHYYLTQYCHAHVSWAGRQVALPDTLPQVPGGNVMVTSNDRFRYYQNVCTVSYSFVWWDWARWEQEIDWMAMNAINFPLAFNAQEAIWNRVYLKMGLTQAEVDAHFGGPAFLAWARMGNMRGWGGPLSQAWHDDQVALQHQILSRMRSLGILPILPAFAGHVPDALGRLYPNVSLSKLGDWGGFNSTYCCTSLLDLQDPLFAQIGKAFIQEYTAEFGTDHVYNTDTFNEMTPKSSEPSYLDAAGKAVFGAMTAGDPHAVWVMQGWLFQESGYWKPAQAQALLTSVPLGRMIVLDLFSEVSPQYTRLQSYYGQPFIWCMLHNFGGTLALYGVVENVNKGPFEGRSFPNSTMIGTGLTPEGINQNDVIYEFMNENAWRSEPRDIDTWFMQYPPRRYGVENTAAAKAWQLLKQSVYNCSDDQKHHNKNVFIRRPSKHNKIDRSTYNCTDNYWDFSSNVLIVRRPVLDPARRPNVWYEPEDLYQAWDLMLEAAKDIDVNTNTLFRYDLVDVTRQSIQVILIKYYNDLVAASNMKNMDELTVASDAIVDLLLSLDAVLGTSEQFLLGRWIASARARGTSAWEQELYEYNARNQVTLWGPSGEILDYANKQWAGLVSHYYLQRWELFIFQLKDACSQGVSFNQTKFNNDVFSMVEQPFTFATNEFPTERIGDALEVASLIHENYRPVTLEHADFFSNLPRMSGKAHKFVTEAKAWSTSYYLSSKGDTQQKVHDQKKSKPAWKKGRFVNVNDVNKKGIHL